jgi:hypothetical protein
MNILIVSQSGHNAVKVTDILPRVGDKVDMFYEPIPTVTDVVLFPTEERMKGLSLRYAVEDIQAIIAVR